MLQLSVCSGWILFSSRHNAVLMLWLGLGTKVMAKSWFGFKKIMAWMPRSQMEMVQLPVKK